MKARRASIASSAIALVLATIPAAAAAQVQHTVEPGESLWSIASVNGLSPGELAAANGVAPDAWLVAGSTVVIPTGSAPPYPTDVTLAPADVGAIAAEYGMSAPLVESMAWNESGFSNGLVSSADARGVMQIIPETWAFIEEQLADQPLDPASAIDNVRAGVIYLHHLYHLKGEDGDAAIGAYYQGPNRDGLLPETRNYIDAIRADEPDFGGGE